MLTTVRETDYDRYLTLLYAPADKRPALAALYAFDAEIATIRNRVRDALPGEVRLQWWQDALAAESTGQATGHPLADALIETIDQYALPKPAFANYLEARIFDVYNDPMPSRTDLEGYCGETAGAIIQLACLVLDPEAALDSAATSGHAGCAQAIAAMLSAVPLHRARGQCYIPGDILAAAGTTPEDFVSGAGGAKPSAAIEAMIALATDHLKIFRAAARSLPASLSPALLPLALADTQLTAMRDPSVVLEGSKDRSPLRKHWVVLSRAWRGWR